MASHVSRRELRTMLSPGAALLLPGVANALAARIVADQGFTAAYVTGAGIANTFLGVPDIGLVTVTELAEHVAAIRAAFPGPLVVDADTGFGNPLNMVRTVELLERAGADALQIEDQVFPKRCGHFAGKEVIPAAEMVAKVKAAVTSQTPAAANPVSVEVSACKTKLTAMPASIQPSVARARIGPNSRWASPSEARMTVVARPKVGAAQMACACAAASTAQGPHCFSIA